MPVVQLITHDGRNIGAVNRHEALRMAQEVGLDLVLISPEGQQGLPIAKIMDFGKNLYEKKKKQGDAKKHQKTIQVKEIKIRPKIADNDYLTKMNQMVGFLNEGKRVKVSLYFKGRENAMKEERGKELFDKVELTLSDAGLLKNIVQEQETKLGPTWSRIYYVKGK